MYAGEDAGYRVAVIFWGSPKGGDSVEEKIKLVLAFVQLILAIAELIRLIQTLLG